MGQRRGINLLLAHLRKGNIPSFSLTSSGYFLKVSSENEQGDLRPGTIIRRFREEIRCMAEGTAKVL